MSSLIRSEYLRDEAMTDRPDVRSLTDPSLRRSQAPADPPAPMLSPSDAKIAALTEEVAALREALRLAREETQEKSTAALKEGRRLAREEFRRDEAAMLDRIETGLSDASERLAAALERSERGGLALARAALERVFGPESAQQQLIQDIIRHQLTELTSRQVLAVRLSEADFPKEAGAPLETLLCDRQIELVRDPQLAAGDCRIVLRLGEREVGPDIQWRALAALFEELAGA